MSLRAQDGLASTGDSNDAVNEEEIVIDDEPLPGSAPPPHIERAPDSSKTAMYQMPTAARNQRQIDPDVEAFADDAFGRLQAEATSPPRRPGRSRRLRPRRPPAATPRRNRPPRPRPTSPTGARARRQRSSQRAKSSRRRPSSSRRAPTSRRRRASSGQQSPRRASSSGGCARWKRRSTGCVRRPRPRPSA